MESIPLSTLKSHFQNPFPRHIFQIVGGEGVVGKDYLENTEISTMEQFLRWKYEIEMDL